MASPALEALTTRNCVLPMVVMAQVMSCALALRGLAKNQAGRPVAAARSPAKPMPIRPAVSASRRLKVFMVIPQIPRPREVGDWQAAENVERMADVAVAPELFAALKWSVKICTAPACCGSVGGRAMMRDTRSSIEAAGLLLGNTVPDVASTTRLATFSHTSSLAAR